MINCVTTYTTDKMSKRARKLIIIKELEKELTIHCEWNACIFSCQEIKLFLNHIALHTSDLEANQTEEGYICLWNNCEFNCESVKEFTGHINFHAYHTKIKGLGKILMDRNGHKCYFDGSTKNIIPEIPESSYCMFGDCDQKFISVQSFYWHTRGHALAEESPYKCLWTGCKLIAKTGSKFIEHMRKHSQEKLFGCYNCGTMFSKLQHFVEHFKRQLQADINLQCWYCSRIYQTEEILKNHVRRHINQFKCPHCEITLPSKGVLSKHMLFKHSGTRKFKCPHCPKKFKSTYNATKHMDIHTSSSSFNCMQDECEYNSNSFTHYKEHIRIVHENGFSKPYLCHICNSSFRFASYLTKHLKKIHKYQWPPGHTRFKYRKDSDGYFKLQTTIYESLAVVEGQDKSIGDISEDAL